MMMAVVLPINHIKVLFDFDDDVNEGYDDDDSHTDYDIVCSA